MSQSSGEKTEQPTQKRLRDAKKKGQVAKSQDLSSSLLLVTATAVLWLISGYWGDLFKNAFQEQIVNATTFSGDLQRATVFAALLAGIKLLAIATLPLLGVMFVFAFAVNFLQVGSLFSAESIKPNFNKLNPVEAFKNKFFKMKSYVEFAKTLLKIVITVIIAWWVLSASMPDLLRLTMQPLPSAIAFISNLALKVFLSVGIAFVLIGAADYFMQRYLHRRELMMTKQEVKQEYKEMEGDPYIKARRRAIHREIISQSMAAAVKSSHVVIANPTHLAVALKYEQGSIGAPIVVAKGADYMAAQIRNIATDAGVPITRDVPLARALYQLEIDEEIPEDLYEAVAVVLRWVYELSEETKL